MALQHTLYTYYSALSPTWGRIREGAGRGRGGRRETEERGVLCTLSPLPAMLLKFPRFEAEEEEEEKGL